MLHLSRRVRFWSPFNSLVALVFFMLTVLATPLVALVPRADANLVGVRFLERDLAPGSQAAATVAQSDWVIDYGGFKVALVDPATANTLRSQGGQPFDYSLALGNQRFDPTEGGLNRATQTTVAEWAARSSADRLSLLQFAAPIRASWIATLEQKGVEVIRVIHPFTAIVWGDVSAVAAPELEPWLRFSGEFHPSFRLLPTQRSLSSEKVASRALVIRAANANLVRSELEALGADVGERADLDAKLSSIGFTLEGNKLAQVAAIPGVYSVRAVPTDGGLRGEMSVQVHFGNVDGSNFALPGYQAYLAGIGLSGAGVVIANVDSGVDATHPDLVGRMTSCTGSTCSTANGSHGTHTAGIMAGDGSSGVTATSTNGDFLRGLGVAPGATLFEQQYSPTFTQPGGMLTLINQSWFNGATLSGNSWGPAGSPQGYDDDTLQVDVGVRDADPNTAGNQEFAYILSFMNGNGGTSSQGSPDEAKNIINVGSTKLQSSPNVQIQAIDDVSANSAHGPALDGRTIPHIVAPGCSVDSTYPNSTHGLGCGTSMASPHVTGTAALYIEQFRAANGVDPSPALIKAALLGTARSLAGNEDADGGTLGHPFDSKQGYGRVDAKTFLVPPASVATVDQTHVFDGSGGEIEYAFDVDDTTQPVRIMLVWTDAPGHGLGGSTPAWNNDLDLEVDASGTTYLGNVFGGAGWSVAGGSADGINNTEGVFLEASPLRTSVTIRIRATDVASDGIPGVGTSTDQDFALYCLNCLNGGMFEDGFESGDTTAWSF